MIHQSFQNNYINIDVISRFSTFAPHCISPPKTKNTNLPLGIIFPQKINKQQREQTLNTEQFVKCPGSCLKKILYRKITIGKVKVFGK